MKILFATLAVLFYLVPAQAAGPFIVCNQMTGVDGFTYILDDGTPVDVMYSTKVSDGVTYALIADVGSVSNGSHNIKVNAFKQDPIWGRSVSATVPFDFTRPSAGSLSGVKLVK